MSLPLPQKLYWKTRNNVEYLFHSATGKGSGLLSHREDERDRNFGFGITDVVYKPQHTEFSLDLGYRLDQSPNNDCVFASRILGRSFQDSIRWSLRWDVKLGRRLGYIKGNGWSSLRAENKIAVEYGRIPYVLMPDEVNGRSWEEYSKWTPEDEALLPVSAQFKVEKYMSVFTTGQAYKAIEQGYTLFTALDWYSEMNRPPAHDNKLVAQGSYIGGHAIEICGYKDTGALFENVQTFGPFFGQGGKVYVESLFGKGKSPIYVEEHYSPEIKAHYITSYLSGRVVRSAHNPKCYLIEEGKKRYIESLDLYWKAAALSGKQHELVPQDGLDLIPEGTLYS